MRALRNFKTDRCCHLISRIANRAFFLTDEERTRFVDRRSALGIGSANFFTSCYLTPLSDAGYIAVDGGERNRYSPGKRYGLSRRGRAVVNA